MQERLESLVVQMHRGGILYQEAVREFKKTFISAALRDNKGNVSKTAPVLGLHRNTLARISLELQLDIRGFRPSSRRPPKSANTAQVPKRAAR
ncbi:MAG: histidine kinase [Acidobacteriia bacterium]|nr:histidine kinase [Terriglobia bacterium]